MIARLGVNIDHVATLRQARTEDYPSVLRAAEVVIKAGADQITMHLREDRRHIQDKDMFEVHELSKKYKIPLNFEMGANDDIVAVAIQVKPEWICLVPENRAEQTTEGGLDLNNENVFIKINSTMEKLYKEIEGVKISLFVEANPIVLKQCMKLKPEAVEIHTGEYARDFLQNKDVTSYLETYTAAYELLLGSGIGFHAGHGLTLESLALLVEQKKFIEYNIGHALVSESLFVGIDQSVRDYKKIIDSESK